MGTKSHGKGSVQTVFPLKDGSALRLTTSKWFTPSGRPIHGEGITPDVDVPFEKPPAEEESAEEKAEEVFDRVENGDPDAAPAEEKKKLDNQLARAVDLLKGIKVFGAMEKATP
jgi:carboxyl-terminal processing protease